MTSSTILNASSLPHFARLRNQLGGCAWVPAKITQFNLGNLTNMSVVATKIANSDSSWLQVDLGNLTHVSAVATQGSCSGDQWTKSYVIMYSANGVDWKHYGEPGTIRVSIYEICGNVVSNLFSDDLIIRFVRYSLVTTTAAVL